MARFAALRAGFVWSLGTVVTAAELARFDEAQNKALSETGGTWTPTEDIIVAGGTFGLYAHILKGGDVGSGTPAFTALGAALATHASSTLTVGGGLVWGGTGTPVRSPAAAFTNTNMPLEPFIGTGTSGAMGTYGTDWDWGSDNGGTTTLNGFRFLSTSATKGAYIRCRLSPNCTYTQIRVFAIGQAGTHGAGALTITKPTVALVEILGNTETVLVAAVPDPTTTGATYEAEHSITLTHTGFRPKTTAHYMLKVTPETGTGAAAGYQIRRADASGNQDRFGATFGDGVLAA